jgi:hypothetical protein
MDKKPLRNVDSSYAWDLSPTKDFRSVFDPAGNTQFETSDNVLFQIDNSYLYALSKGWPSRNEFTTSNPISLPEDSSTVHLLFHFIHPLRLPNFLEQDFNVMESLATAAEKYKVYSAMNVCRIYMRFVGRIFSSTLFLLNPCR